MDLPIEILQEVVGYLSSLSDLARCARVNRTIGACALSVLYRNIDLNTTDYMYHETARRKSIEKQVKVLRTIAESE